MGHGEEMGHGEGDTNGTQQAGECRYISNSL